MANTCHRCSSGFKTAMISVMTVALLTVLIVSILLGSYLVSEEILTSRCASCCTESLAKRRLTVTRTKVPTYSM